MIPTFLLGLAGGMLLVLATGKFGEIAWKFMRLCGYLALALATTATTVVLLGPDFAENSWRMLVLFVGIIAGLNAAALALMAPLAARLSQTTRVLCTLGGAAAVCGSIWTLHYGTDDFQPVKAGLVLSSVNQLSAALLLGAITVAWLLGHAYLTATKMTIAPLRHFSRMLSWAVILRIGFVLVSLLIAAWRGGSNDVLADLANFWLVVSLRVGVGLVATGAFAYLVADCVRRRSTQSATGILYFGSLFAYIGELAAQYLTHEIGWPM